ncbi:hypothetical protein AFM12_06500 [Jiulongibacter sediminis]|uniref:Uncharacterized protein n=1 Tax=Jiulongibacter sediminis TaxID=1605367 RepID=A0A0N8H9T9_9BACT|nr:hypothetical protein AFM12_06500 [Jiulongibacter sediminis]TBX24839.1 hypothetical protein TK44_06505 [Jiulongibacter sediminis]
MTVYGQGVVENNFDPETFKNKAAEEINAKIQGQIEEWLDSGYGSAEDIVMEQTYWKDMLAQYEAWGIDPEETPTDYFNKAKEIYTNIKEDPDYDPKADLSGRLQDMIKTRVENEIGNAFDSVIDKESQQIYSDLQGLYNHANAKILKIAEGLEKIGEWDEEAPDFESKLEAEVRNWGFKGPIADFVGDMDNIYTQVNDQYGTQINMAGNLISLLNEDDPTGRIEGLFEFGANYGGEIPILGDIVANLFEVGKELLAAAKRAGGILERNYGQGCMNNQGEYNSLTTKKKQFRDKFPNVVSACPLSYSISSGPYYHIYEENKNLYFYFNKSWHGAPATSGKNGADDVWAIIQWLRRIGNENYYDLATIYSIYVKEPGFAKYREQINEKASAIQQGVRNSLQNISYCNDADLEKYLFDDIDLNWIRRLLGNDQLDFSRAKTFDDGLIEQMEDQLLENRYFRAGASNNLNQLDAIIEKLKKNIPVYFNGRVISSGTQKPLEGATVTPPFPSLVMFTGDNCRKLTTDENGRYSFYMRMDPDQYRRVGILTSYEGVSTTPEFELELPSRTYYQFTLRIDLGEEEELIEQEKCEEKEGYVWDSENQICVADVACEVENTVKVLNEAKTGYICDCASPNKWNEDQTQCLTPEQQAVSETDSVPTDTSCTEPFTAWNSATETCDCIEGYTRNDQGICVPDDAEIPEGQATLTVSPSSVRIDVSEEVSFQVTYTDSTGESFDVTQEVSPQPFFPGKEGVHQKTFTYRGVSASAIVAVGGCADPNAEEIDGDCQCKEGFSPDFQGNCQPEGDVFTAISIDPAEQTIGVGDNPGFVVIGVNALGETLDITNRVSLSGASGIGDVSGTFTISATIQGLSAEAQVNVNECGDPNAELNTTTGNCDCKDGYLPDENGKCVSDEELKEELEEEALEECENLATLASEYSSVIGQINSFQSDYIGFKNRFLKEVNDRASDLCQNQMAAFAYAQALSAYENLRGSIDQGKELYFQLSYLSQCPSYEAETGQYNLGSYDLNALLDQISGQESSLAEMNSRIKENGCNEEDIADIGRTVVDSDKDPELISMGGTGNELSGDGKDNDGEGQEDEIPVSAEPGYNVTIVIYDSGSAKDDVFSLYISGAGDFGTTPEGGLRTYPMQLPPGDYVASVSVLEDGGNVGTYTINIFVNGMSVFSTSNNTDEGVTDSFNFSVN